MDERQFNVYGRIYPVQVARRRPLDPSAPRLVIVGLQFNDQSRDLLRLCIDSVRQHTPEPHELWVIDNASAPRYRQWLLDDPELNVIINPTPPAPPPGLISRIRNRRDFRYSGSYANAVGLELAARAIDEDSRLLMTLHMDTMACRSGWLSYMIGRMTDKVRAVGVRLDEARGRVLHVLGLMFDYQLSRRLGLGFRHNMPHHDVGDAISLGLERAGYELWACPNTLHEPKLIDMLPADSPYRRINVDRSLDDSGEVIFMHLGRGVAKSTSGTPIGKTSPGEWLSFGREVVLKQ